MAAQCIEKAAFCLCVCVCVAAALFALFQVLSTQFDI